VSRIHELADPEHVAEQYGDASRFDARVQLYKFSTEPQSWLQWVFDRLHLKSGDCVLEVGCGTANIWRENARRIPPGIDLVLSDASAGMLAEAQARLAQSNLRARFEIMDAQSLAVRSESFDIVLANHMLYHVPDRAAALAEFRRVLRPDARVAVATNGSSHLWELRQLLDRFLVRSGFLRANSRVEAFDLDAAVREVSAHFEEVEEHRRDDTLVVTELDSLLSYIRSMVPAAEQDSPRLIELAEYLRREIGTKGSFTISVRAGVVLGVRGR
jgi:ubiquinone/menaquinone biosynthesis C-methylase UbiE